MSAARALSERVEFIEMVRYSFDAAGIEYAFLHADHGYVDRDSDVDVVVRREHLPAVEAIVRAGDLGLLTQCVEYEAPWCRCYVLATGDARRPFRQLDIACDPFGISRYGDVLALALDYVRRVDGRPTLLPEMRLLYLAAKRAQKGIRSPDDLDALRSTFSEDPSACARLLAQTWRRAGVSFAAALGHSADLEPSLAGIGCAIRRTRTRPARRLLRGWYEVVRTLRRIAHPTGLVIQLVGPDGAGKSTLADELEARLAGAFQTTRRLHLTPGILPPPARLLGRAPGDPSAPHARRASGRLASYARIAYLGIDTLLGWPTRCWLPRGRGTLVIVERGWDDLAVDPSRYRLSAGSRLVEVLCRVLPSADFVLSASGDPRMIYSRKPELTEKEVTRQVREWRARLVRWGSRAVEIDTTLGGGAAAAVESVATHLRRRAGDLSEFGAARESLGMPRAGGSPLSLVSDGRQPRWILPRRPGAPGPSGAALYRAAGPKHVLAAAVWGAMQRSGGVGHGRLAVDRELGLGPKIAAALAVDRVEFGCLLPTDATRSDRTTLSIMSDGAPVAFAKVTARGSVELARERELLTVLRGGETGPLLFPAVLASFGWRKYDVLVLSLVSAHGRTDRPLGRVERRAMVQLAALTPLAEPVLGPATGRVLVHGDFCGWNSAAENRRLALWDWEWSHLGLPLEDYFHWQTQRLIHFGRGSVEELVRAALDPTSEVAAVAHQLGADPAIAPASLQASLEAGLASLGDARTRARSVRERAIELLRISA